MSQQNKTRTLRKLVSVNPNRWEERRLDELWREYNVYMLMCDDEIKSFIDWLDTEI